MKRIFFLLPALVLITACGNEKASATGTAAAGNEQTGEAVNTVAENDAPKAQLSGSYRVYQVDAPDGGDTSDETVKTFDFSRGGLSISGGREHNFMTDELTMLNDSTFKGFGKISYAFKMAGEDEMIIRPSYNNHIYRLKKQGE